MWPAKAEGSPLLGGAAKGWSNVISSTFGIASREVWTAIVVALLFVGKGSTPFAVDILHGTQTALIADTSLGMDAQVLSQLSSSSLATSAIAK